MASLNNDNKSKTGELKLKAYSNEYTNALKFYKENNDKFEDLTGERKQPQITSRTQVCRLFHCF